MIRSGLVSVTFRKLPPTEVVALAAGAGLEAIEWGGDAHVPPEDLAAADRIGRMTRDAGLAVASYGSYYRLGDQQEAPARAVLAAASALGAPVVRVWAGRLASRKADADFRQRVIHEARRMGDQAADLGLVLACEFHGGTLTDTNVSARRLMEEINHPRVQTYWQPPVGATVEYCLAGLEAVGPWLCNLHVFHWLAEPKARLALAEGEQVWRQYLAKAASTGKDLHAMLEFVRDDSAEAFAEDARTLKRWLAELNAGPNVAPTRS